LAPLDAAAHHELCSAIARIISTHVAGGDALISAISDVSGGGLAVTLAEMARSSAIGVEAEISRSKEAFFGEGPSRFVIATRDVERLMRALGGTATCTVLGIAGGELLSLGGISVGVGELATASTAIFDHH
jgi:phosphoribosylformylglycinamidine (FGAM) synthase-like enzyme